MIKGTRHTSERLINTVAVGVVLVDGSGPTHFSLQERLNVAAEVQEGLEMLSGLEPDARVTWIHRWRSIKVDVEPWDGARWPGLPDHFYRGIDAALWREDNRKIYFFRGSEYVRYSRVTAGVDPGYPKPIAGNWPGLPHTFNQGIDAALWRESNQKLYFFKGDQYVRFSKVSNGMDPGYPKPIAGNWPGLPLEFRKGIDAALMRKDNHKIYFFKGDRYVRYSKVSAGVDPGYPKPIVGNWKGLPEDFAKSTRFSDGIDAALWRESNKKVYLFKKHRTAGEYIRFSKVADGMDASYPKPIGLTREEAEAAWRDPALAALGHPPGTEGVKAYVEALRTQLGTQWGFVAFFTKHPTTWFAYARTPRIVMRYGSDDFDRVFAHEVGHVFGAPDEYANSACNCGKLSGRFFREKNGNCALCDPDPAVSCLMRANSPALCAYTPKHFGWGAFLTKVDAAVWRQDVDRLYLFSNDEYVRFTHVPDGRDEGYPRRIAGNWPGLPSAFRKGIDAALWREDNGKLYFFKGSQYVRFSKVRDGVDSGYPKSIAGNWPGLPSTFEQGIDAAFWRESNGKVYLFKGSQYVRFSKVSDGVDAGYPRSIGGNWPGLPASYQGGIDGALMRKDNHRIYFFRGRTYIRYSKVTDGIDPGYPRWIDGNWMPFPR